MKEKIDYALMAKEINDEIAAIKKLDPKPTEAIYKWIDSEVGIPENAPGGGASHPVDALPVVCDEEGKCHATAVPFLPILLARLKCPRLVGLVQYRRASGTFLQAIPLRTIQQYWDSESLEALKTAMREAFERAVRDEPLGGK
jgi:hypothetical protein